MRQARRSNSIQSNTIILIDEAWLLMKFPQGAKFLAEFARRIRKYGGGLWCTTQNSDDFLGSEEGRTILAMATMKFLMKQDTYGSGGLAQRSGNGEHHRERSRSSDTTGSGHS